MCVILFVLWQDHNTSTHAAYAKMADGKNRPPFCSVH
jgi:hypothetical protein